MDDLLSVEEGHKGRRSQKSPEWKSVLEVFLLKNDEKDTHHCPSDGGQDKSQQGLLPAEECADHQHHRHIAHAQSLFFAQKVISAVDEQEKARSHASSKQGLSETQVITKKRVDESQNEAGQGYLIRQDLVVIVDESQDDERTGEQTGYKKVGAQ